MHRMIFEDLKQYNPECEIHFACPPSYHPLVKDHPFIDKVLDCREICIRDYNAAFDTSTACGRYELTKAPLSDLHRSDIWAAHCGFILKKHNMNIVLSEKEKEWGKAYLKHVNPSDAKNTLFCPISAQVGKNMKPSHMATAIKTIRDNDSFAIGIHNTLVPELTRLGVPIMSSLTMRQWMAVMSAVDYCVAVDTGHFHLAGGLGIPLTGLFTYADGKVYGKYYKFELIQKHRDNGDWSCGPCYNWGCCVKDDGPNPIKPCLTEISDDMISEGIQRMFDRWGKYKKTSLEIIQ